jgi:hypothetical protein
MAQEGIMRKSVKNVKNSLKFKARPKSGAISVKVGAKKYTVPISARILSNENFIFLSFPACSALFEIHHRELKPLPPEADATEAYAQLNPFKKRNRVKVPQVSIPKELVDALRALPADYKVGYGTDGAPRLVRKRRRS